MIAARKSVASRLRIAFAIVSALSVVAAIAGYFGAYRVQSSHDTLVDTAAPGLIEAEALYRRRESFDDSMEALSGARNYQDFRAARTNAEWAITSLLQASKRMTTLGRLKEKTAGFGVYDAEQNWAKDLAQLELAGRKTILAAHKVVTSIEYADQLNGQAAEAVVVLRDATGPSYTAPLKSLAALISLLAEADAPQDLERLGGEIESALFRLMVLSNRVEGSEIEAELSTLRSKLMFDGGAVNARREAIAAVGQLQEAANESRRVSRRMDNHVGDVLRDARARIMDASIETNSALDELVLVLAAVAAASVIAAGAVGWRVVERDVTQRITALNNAMAAMARGELDVKVPNAHRKDEFGDMAWSMEILRANSRNALILSHDYAEASKQAAMGKAETEVLERALQKEREANELQRQFVAMVSHEFRTPLAIIDGAGRRIQSCIDQERSSDARSHVDRVKMSVKRLTLLMDSVLNVSRMDAGAIKFNAGPCALGKVVREAAVDQQFVARRHEILIDLDNLPEEIHADGALLYQVFSNLIGNAVKYSGEGSTVKVVGRTEDDGLTARIDVIDQGVGVPKDELEKLFGRFFRASTSGEIAGTGVGLHLCQELVSLHGGRIGVESEVGQGSVFSVKLPVCGLQKGDAPSTEAAVAVA